MQKNNSRIFISYFLFAFVAIIIVFRVIYIQKSDEKLSSSNAPKFCEIEALRGNIKKPLGVTVSTLKSLKAYNVKNYTH